MMSLCNGNVVKYNLLDSSSTLFPIFTLECPEAYPFLRVLVIGLQPVKTLPDGQSSVAPYTGASAETCGADVNCSLSYRNHAQTE